MSGVPHDDSPSPPLKDRSITTVALLILLVLFFGNGIWGSVTRTDASNVNTVVGVPNYDFYIYYVAGSDWALGLSPYANHPDRPAARRFPTGGDGKMDGFLYPPTFLPVYGLLSHLPYNTARLLWLDLNLTAFVAAIIAAAFFVRRRWAEFVTAAVILTIGAFAFTYSIQQGQIDLLASSLLVLAFVLYGRKRGWPTAALLAIAVLAKPTSAMVVVALVAYHRDLRLLGKTAAIGAILVAASLALVDLGLYRDYVTSVLPAAAATDPNWNNLSPLRYLSGVPSLARAVSLAGYVLLGALCYFAG
ncbi:MAG: glycosyltransferase family 87 protein, partial [Actinomycetes bacterium]